MKSRQYYPQGNCQAEATHKTLLRILSRTVYEELKRWQVTYISGAMGILLPQAYFHPSHTFLPSVWVEGMVSIEVIVPSACLAHASKLLDSLNCIYGLEVLEERRDSAENKWLSYQKQISKTYNKRVRSWSLYVGDSVLKAAGIKKASVPQSLALSGKDHMFFARLVITAIILSLYLIWRSPSTF